MSSVHKECGADITWARRDDNPEKWMPPLEYIGEVYLIDGKGEDRTAVQRHAYRLHICDPDRIIEWQDYMHRLAEAKGEVYDPHGPGTQFEYEAKREKEREQTWNMALKVDCPRCSQPAGQKCISQSIRLIKTGEIEFCKNPHPARMESFEFWFKNESPAQEED